MSAERLSDDPKCNHIDKEILKGSVRSNISVEALTSSRRMDYAML
jgi:hypothetical protein